MHMPNYAMPWHSRPCDAIPCHTIPYPMYHFIQYHVCSHEAMPYRIFRAHLICITETTYISSFKLCWGTKLIASEYGYMVNLIYLNLWWATTLISRELDILIRLLISIQLCLKCWPDGKLLAIFKKDKPLRFLLQSGPHTYLPFLFPGSVNIFFGRSFFCKRAWRQPLCALSSKLCLFLAAFTNAYSLYCVRCQECQAHLFPQKESDIFMPANFSSWIPVGPFCLTSAEVPPNT